MTTNNKSPVWEDFDKVEDDKARCKICHTDLQYKGGSTSNLLKHMQRVHKKDYATSDSGTSKKKTLADFGITTGRPCPNVRKNRIDELITAVVTQNNLPFTFVESRSLRTLLNYIEPNYNPMCAKTVKGKVEEQAITLKQQIKKDLRKCSSVSLTTDCWTSINNEAFMAVTCSFLNENWKIMSPVLETRYLSERHFADYLQAELSTVIEDWEIKDRVFAIVHDNASNIKKVATAIDNNFVDISCAAHLLQICVNNAMGTNKTGNNPISKTINSASRLIAHFNHSTLANNELKKRQKLMSEAGENNEQQQIYSLIQYVKTRWNSVADMFERLLKLRWPISAVLSDRNVTKYSDAKTLDLTNDQWDLIEAILPALISLKKANTLLCGEKFVTLSCVWPIMKMLVDHHLKIENTDTGVLKQFKNELIKNITEKFQLDSDFTSTSIPTALLTSALDPRYKNLLFLTEEAKQKVFMKIMEEIETEEQTTSTEGSEIETCSPSPKRKKPEDDFFAVYDTAAKDCEIQTNSEKEIHLYQSFEVLERNGDPLGWWQTYEKRLPQLSRLAKKYLCVPATSVASERHFSAAGRTVSKIRNRLLPETTDVLLFVSENSEYLSDN